MVEVLAIGSQPRWAMTVIALVQTVGQPLPLQGAFVWLEVSQVMEQQTVVPVAGPQELRPIFAERSLVWLGWSLQPEAANLPLIDLDRWDCLAAPLGFAVEAGSWNCQGDSLPVLACPHALYGLVSSCETSQMHFPSSLACRNPEGFRMLWKDPSFDASRIADFAESR